MEHFNILSQYKFIRDQLMEISSSFIHVHTKDDNDPQNSVILIGGS